MNIFKTFGLKKASTKEEVAKDPTMAIGTDLDEVDRKSKRDWIDEAVQARREGKDLLEDPSAESEFPSPSSIDDMIDREHEEEWARDTDEHFATQEEADRPEASVPVKGRPDETPLERSERAYKEAGYYPPTRQVKPQTLADKRAGRTKSDVGGSRTMQRDPMPYEGRGKDFGIGGAYRKPKAEVMNMFKVFVLHKADKEDEHPDEDKKKTPNGGENGD